MFRNADYSQITTTSLERDTNVSSRHRQPSPPLKRCFYLEEFKNPATACKGFNPKQNDKLTLDTLASFDQGRFPAISQGSNVTRLMRTHKTFQPERKGKTLTANEVTFTDKGATQTSIIISETPYPSTGPYEVQVTWTQCYLKFQQQLPATEINLPCP